MADIPNDWTTRAVITGTGVYSSALELDGDSDYWRLSLADGFIYNFTITGDGANSLDAIIYLRNGEESIVAQYDGGATFSLLTGGNVRYLDVSDALSDAIAEGNYAITVTMTDVVAGDTSTTAKFAYYTATKGFLEEDGDSDWYKVDMVAGLSYSFRVVGVDSFNSMYLHLRDASGNSIVSVYDGVYLTFTAKTSGTYYVDVRDANPADGKAVGEFDLTVHLEDRIPADASTDAVIRIGYEGRVNIEAVQDKDWYRLDAKKGVTYDFSTSDGYILLRDADGKLVASTYGTMTYKASYEGSYYVEFRLRSDDRTGHFNYRVRSDERDIYGTDSNEQLSGMDNDNVIFGRGGHDFLQGNGGNDILFGGRGDDTLNGGAGFDIAHYAGDVGVRVDLGNTQDTGMGRDVLNLIEGITGSSVGDQLTGNRVANLLNGSGGNDLLRGMDGSDTLIGGVGNDTIEGGNGIDTLQFLAGKEARFVDLRQTGAQNTREGLDVIKEIENVIGDGGNDTIFGSTAANTLEGRGGDDRLLGYEGNDRLLGGAGNDFINGGVGIDTAVFNINSRVTVDLAITAAQATGEGTDTIVNIEYLEGGGGNDIFYGNGLANRFVGNNGNDFLDGRAGADGLLGGAGNDTLRGGDGNDGLTGGIGADVLLFLAGDDADQILDFQQGVDRIEFRTGAERYSDLSFIQVGANTHVIYGDSRVILHDTQISEMSSSDFIFT